MPLGASAILFGVLWTAGMLWWNGPLDAPPADPPNGVPFCEIDPPLEPLVDMFVLITLTSCPQILRASHLSSPLRPSWS